MSKVDWNYEATLTRYRLDIIEERNESEYHIVDVAPEGTIVRAFGMQQQNPNPTPDFYELTEDEIDLVIEEGYRPHLRRRMQQHRVPRV